MRLPLKIAHKLIEFPGLPEKETVELVTQIQNPTSKTYMVELLPPKPQLSGIVLTPVVMQIPPQKSSLISIKYKSLFREFNAQTIEKLKKDEEAARKAKEVQGIINPDQIEEEEEEKEEDIDKKLKRKKRRNKKLGNFHF